MDCEGELVLTFSKFICLCNCHCLPGPAPTSSLSLDNMAGDQTRSQLLASPGPWMPVQSPPASPRPSLCTCSSPSAPTCHTLCPLSSARALPAAWNGILPLGRRGNWGFRRLRHLPGILTWHSGHQPVLSEALRRAGWPSAWPCGQGGLYFCRLLPIFASCQVWVIIRLWVSIFF